MTMELSADPGVLVRRRNLLYAGMGAAAAVAGAAIGIWRWEGGGNNASPDVLWTQTFETPAGAPLAMQAFRGKPLLLNFWATWCPPCVEEMPLLDAFFRENASKRWQVVGLAIDQPSAVRAFLQRTRITYPIGLAGLGGTELAKELGNTSGGLPFTAVLDAAGQVRARKMGRASPGDLSQWAGLG